jgi:hypothetical protein
VTCKRKAREREKKRIAMSKRLVPTMKYRMKEEGRGETDRMIAIVFPTGKVKRDFLLFEAFRLEVPSQQLHRHRSDRVSLTQFTRAKRKKERRRDGKKDEP